MWSRRIPQTRTSPPIVEISSKKTGYSRHIPVYPSPRSIDGIDRNAGMRYDEVVCGFR